MVDIFYKENNTDAVRLIADNNTPTSVREGLVVDVSPVGQIGVRMAGTLNITYHDSVVGSKVEVGDRVRLVRSENTKKWVVVGAYTAASSTANTQAGSSVVATNYLGVPENVTAEGVPGMIVFRWQTPGNRADVFFELYVSNDTAGAGAVTYKVSGTIYCLAIASGTTKYAKVRTVDSLYNRSGYSDWVTATSAAYGGAPSNATYITQTADGTLSNEQALSALSTGLMKNTNGTGVVSIAVGSDVNTTMGTQQPNYMYAGPTSGSAANPSFRALVAKDLELIASQWAFTHRLSLSSGAPVTVGDVTGSTLYLTPYTGNRIAIADVSGNWHFLTVNQLSMSIAGWTAGNTYDIYLNYGSGTPAIYGFAWSGGSRPYAQQRLDGRIVISGAYDYLYVGSCYCASNGISEVSSSRMLVWNHYNRIRQRVYCKDTTDNWTYTTATWRASNNSTTVATARVEICLGQQEDVVQAITTGMVTNSSGASVAQGIGVDSTSANSAQMTGAYVGSADKPQVSAFMEGSLVAGYHYIQRLEISAAVGTTTWYGDNGLSYNESGMVVTLWG